MKIGYIVNTYPRPSHTFIRREIRAVERLGHEVHRFAMRSDRAALVDPEDLEEDDRTEHVLKLGTARLALGLVKEGLRHPARALGSLRLAMSCGARAETGRLRHLIYLAEAVHIAARCRALGIQHLHAHFGTNSATVAMLVRTLGGPGYSFTTHGPEEFDHPAALSLGEKAHRAAFAVTISSYGRSQLCRWTPAADWPRLHVVHCGIEPARFVEPAPLPKGAGRMVAIGRLSEQKGQLLLIEALARAQPACPDLHLTLVGDGEMRPEIEAAIATHGLAGNVTLTGWLDEAGVRRALAEAHALVLPSFAEGLPMVVMEAMAAARPVIATMIAGIPELVQPSKTGWLVPAGDADAFAEAMQAVAWTEPATLAKMGTEGRERVLERHDVDREAAKLSALFERYASKD